MKPQGSIERRGDRFVLKGQPHVMQRLKRVFGRLNKARVEEIVIKDTLEVCRDLVWLCDRWPLEMSPEVADYVASRAREHEARGEYVERLYAGALPPRRFELALPPRRYQEVAAEALLARGSLLLADDLGLGKTVSAICALTSPDTRPALIVTMSHLPHQWAAELQRFAPELGVHLIKKGTPYRIGPRRRKKDETVGLLDEAPDILITNYHKLAGWARVLAGVIKMVVFDECQELRRGLGSHKGQAAAHIADEACYRLGLTATPIYNYGGEFWNVLRVIDPTLLGSYTEFMTEWCETSDERKACIAVPEAFGTYLRQEGAVLRRTCAEVGRELPPVTVDVHEVDHDPDALKKIEKNAAELARLILTQGGKGFDKMRASEELSFLVRQATGIGKAPYVAAFVRLLVESGERVVLYGWHREVYTIWLRELEDLSPRLYTGTESPTQKKKHVEEFVAGDCKVLIISLRAGAGLDGLQRACRVVVFGEIDWSPGVHEQNIGRVARDGQEHAVMVYMLLADRGSDPVIADVLGLKRGQMERVRDPSHPLVQKLQIDPDHIKRLAKSYLLERRKHLSVVEVQDEQSQGG